MIVTLHISVRASQHQKVVFSLNGEIDLTTCSAFADILSKIIDEGFCDLAIDMGGVSYCDCSGIRVLLMACQRLSKGGGTLRVTSASPIVQRILETVGLDELLDIRTGDQAPLNAIHGRLDDFAQQEAWLQVQRTLYPAHAGESVCNN